MAASEQANMASAVLRHPIRVRLIEALKLWGELSATSFVNAGLGKGLDALEGRDPRLQARMVGYHLKEMEKADCVYETRRERRRGAKEVFYRSNVVAFFSTEEWETFDIRRREEISRVVAQGFIVQIEGAMLAGTFDSRADRWLLYEPLDLDGIGWKELHDGIAAFHEDVQRIRDEAEERRKDQGGGAPAEVGGDDLIRTTFGVVAFESPLLPLSPTDVEAPDDHP